MVKCTGRGLVVKQLGVLSKVQMLNLVLGVGVFSLLPIIPCDWKVLHYTNYFSWNSAEILLLYITLS